MRRRLRSTRWLIGAVAALSAVVGFDDLEAAALAHPPLTTIRQDRAKLGVVAAERALELIEHTETTPPETILPVELIVRSSTAGV